MYLERLETYGFRNLRDGTVAFDPGINLITGLNGQGKTNLIEAVYCACLSKSFRTRQLEECAAYGSRGFRVLCSVLGGVLLDLVETRFSDGEKRLLLNGSEADVTRIIERAPVLCVTAEHFGIVSGGPDPRRKFFDGLLALFQPVYLTALARYRRTLRQKSAVLHRGKVRMEELETWNRALLDGAQELVERRAAFIAQFSAGIPTDRFSGAPLAVVYHPSLPLELLREPEAAEKLLRERAQREIESGRCLYGPHLDRYEITLDGHPVRKFGSSGQKRSVLFTFYLNALHLFMQIRGAFPIVLVDDADMELDRSRILTFVEALSEASQIFLTTSKPELFEGVLHPHRRLRVCAGEVSPG
ncbi:MAG: DNA replication/repair protein RecF [Acidobacteria bacterium]|nr:DNA replication/repair protein RecF [Acidobacteriota bacterium]